MSCTDSWHTSTMPCTYANPLSLIPKDLSSQATCKSCLMNSGIKQFCLLLSKPLMYWSNASLWEWNQHSPFQPPHSQSNKTLHDWTSRNQDSPSRGSTKNQSKSQHRTTKVLNQQTDSWLVTFETKKKKTLSKNYQSHTHGYQWKWFRWNWICWDK